MKTLSLLLALFFFSITIHAQDQEKLLEHAYKTKSKKELKQFFDTWYKEIPPISDSEFAKLTDLQKETYMVFEAFYHPENQKLIGKSELGDSVYLNASFLIVQNRVDIYRTNYICINYADSDSFYVHLIKTQINLYPDDLSFKNELIKARSGILSSSTLREIEFLRHSAPFPIPVDSILNFRPVISCGLRIPVYDDNKHARLLYRFLENNSNKFHFMNPAKDDSVSEQKNAFLKNYVSVLGHRNFWLILSYPVANSIAFNNTLTRAQIDFRFAWEGGSAIFKKENNKWKLIYSSIYWVN